MKAPLRLLILSDGRPGHVSSSRGIVELIASARPCDVDILEIHLRAKFLRPLLRHVMNSSLAGRLTGLYGQAWLKLFYRGFRPIQADAVVSAGGDTLYLNAYAGRCLGITNFFCGSMRGIDPGLFQLIVHTRAADLPNWQAMELLPSALNIERAMQAAVAFANKHLDGERSNLWALLIGGNGNGYRFLTEDVMAIMDGIHSLAERHGKRLLVTTSRRTSGPTEDALQRWMVAKPRAAIAYCVLYNRKPERVAGAFMALAETVFCTEDSTSMISEAALSGRPVLTLIPPIARPVPDHTTFLQQLVDNGRIIRLDISQLPNLDMTSALAGWRPYGGEDHRRLKERMLVQLPSMDS